jgi:zinc-binding alcohol dehydrogenase/oxidoreductase
MHAVVFSAMGQTMQCLERPELEPGEGQAIVQLQAAGLNRRDYWITQGKYPDIRTPVVLGSDGAGTVTQVGSDVSTSWLGRQVVLYPGIDWGPDPAVQGASFRVLGMPEDGTFATSIAVPVESLFDKPAHLSWQEAAALPLAGVTAYRALVVQGNVQPGQKVLITGIGGGVASFALQFAVAGGAEVWVTSSSTRKIQHAVSLGAQGGFDYCQSDWHRELLARCGPMDLVVDSAGGNGYGDLIQAAAPGARVVSYGSTAGRPADLDLFKVFWKQLKLIGSTMGSPEDFAAMLDAVQRHQIHPVVDQVFSLEDGATAVAHMADCPQFGKLVLNCRI